MFDYKRLLGRIVEKCDTQARFAQLMGLSERSISLKLNGKVDFKQSEIDKACTILDISADEIPAYFFNVKVQNIEQVV